MNADKTPTGKLSAHVLIRLKDIMIHDAKHLFPAPIAVACEVFDVDAIQNRVHKELSLYRRHNGSHYQTVRLGVCPSIWPSPCPQFPISSSSKLYPSSIRITASFPSTSLSNTTRFLRDVSTVSASTFRRTLKTLLIARSRDHVVSARPKTSTSHRPTPEGRLPGYRPTPRRQLL